MIKKTKTAALRLHKTLVRKRIHLLVYGILLACAVSITAQVLYPADRALPNARIDSVQVGGLDRKTIINALQNTYTDSVVTLQIRGKKTEKVKLPSTGVVLNYSDSAAKTLDYQLWQRLIPFSFVYKMGKTYETTRYIDDEVFSEFSGNVAGKCAISPVNAAIEIKDGHVSLRSAKDGQKCDQKKLQAGLLSGALGDTTLVPPVTPIKPALTDEKVKTQFVRAKQIVDGGVTLGSPVEQWKVPREVVASWLTVASENNTLKLTVNSDAVKKYLSEYKGKTHIQPGQTTVHLLDGVEVRRESGASGQGIDTDVTVKRITDGLLASKVPSVIWTQLAVLSPAVTYDRQYSQSDVGMQAMIEQWDRDNAGRYGILVRDLSGRGLNAALNADRDFVTASTYKQFLAYAIMHKIELGQMSFDDGTSTGLSVRGCIDEMILHSTNPCATALMGQADWGYVNDYIHTQFPSTILNNGASSDGDKHSTVRDEVTFQTRLNSGTLEMNSDNHAYLLGLLKRQIYRSGIPRGVPGVTVANKVGFYDGYKHDIAIIYGPKGAYQLGIMSYGGADWRFEDLSRRVAALMNR